MTARNTIQWLFVAAIATLGLSACMANSVAQSILWLLDQLKYVADIVACLLMMCLMAFLMFGLPNIGKWLDNRRRRERERWN
jgi:hypothetical protein